MKDDADARYQLARGLHEHPQPWSKDADEDVSAVHAYWTDGSDEPMFAWLLELKDGRWVAASGGHDYTGWDCQSHLESTVHATREEAIRFGLTLNQRCSLGLLLPEETT